MAKISSYHPWVESPYQGRLDSKSRERLFQVIELLDLTSSVLPVANKNSVCFLGFCSDEGVRRNLGRVGAKQGPDEIRKNLGNLPIHEFSALNFYDAGNVVCEGENLELSQQILGQLVAKLLMQSFFPIIFGGGHETAWGHYQGINATYPQKKIGIINFDAHFDLRPLLEGKLGSSGTSFLQIAQLCHQQRKAFNYLVIGIQSFANTKSLFKTAEDLNVQYIPAEELFSNNISIHNKIIHDFIDKNEVIYLSFCLDVFNEAYAPGVSAPQALGLTPEIILPYLKLVMQSGKVASFDIVEYAPNLDRYGQTSRLAIQLIGQVLKTL